MLRALSILLSALIALAGATASTEALAAAWPERPLRLIVPFTAGSSSDTIARVVAAKMGLLLGQQVVVDNRAGGSTIIGTDAVAKAAPDGYTLGLANTTTHAASVALNSNLPFDPVKDFTPVGMIGSSPFVLVTAPHLPASTLKDFIRLAKAKPGVLSYASAGNGTLAHLAGELFKHRAGIDVAHISYRGTAQSTMDLLQGRIDLSVSTIPPTKAHIREGKLRALAVTSDRRNPALPETPTIREAGTLDCEAALWTAFVLPAGIPADIARRLNGVLNDVVNSPDVQDALRLQGVEPEPGSPSAVSSVIAADIAKWRQVVTAANILGQK